MKKSLLLTTLLVLTTVLGFSQADRFWSANYESRSAITPDKSVARQSYPKSIKLFNLNFAGFQQELFSVVGKSSKHSTVISLPNADGNIEQFEVFEASNFEPDLQARFPEIRAYSGKGITDKYATLKLSISPQGIQTMVFRTESDNEFMEPYSKDHTVYSVYKSHREKGMLPWSCSTADQKMAAEIKSAVQKTQSSAGQLKTMRLAQSCNGEYSNYFGATSAAQVGLVLAAFNATLTRCNGVYEKDLALHLNLIANTTSVIYYNPASDPYTTLPNWNSQLQSTLTTNIGEANYDIGHMFGASGGGGNAGCIGCVCVNGSKGSGITSPADGIPQGDNFDIDYVVHEVGHQLGANHTFTFSSEGGAILSSVQKEVGSGITIMGYAGITSQDVAPHSIEIFHQASIAQIQTNLASKTCPVTTNIAANNATPVVNAVSNRTIPISTPFALTGSATDANGDPLTYCWEQNDATTSLTGASSVASPTKAAGPNWLSFSPTISPIRLFPRLSTILAGALVTGPLAGGDAGANIEALSSVSRTLNFRLTVRDNAPYSSVAPVKVGQTNFTNMTVTVSNTSGPFAVTSPNTPVFYVGGSSQTITWSVNNTTAAPVSCSAVRITLSTDGGFTFPFILATATPNDGSEVVTIPNTAATNARIKIEAVGNIFFDISNANFSISQGNPLTANPTNNGPSCPGTTLNLFANASGGTPPYTYSWTGPNAFTSTLPNPSIAGVSSVNGGTYTVIVKDAQSPQATFTTTTTVVIKTQPTATVSPAGPITVCDNNTPVILTASTNATSPFYIWRKGGVVISPFQTGSTLSVTESGSYTVVIVGNDSCGKESVPVLVTVKKSSGSLTNVAICGTSYSWNGMVYTASGTYAKTFVNSVGCDSVATLHLLLSNITTTFTKSDSICFGSTGGFVSVVASGGVPPYSYKLGTTGTYQSSGIFRGLKAGNYRVYIIDSIGCTAFTSYMLISQYPKITTTLTKVDAACYGTATGSVTATAANGLPPYSYRLGTTGVYGSANTFNGLVAGSYRVYVIDARGCEVASSTIVVGQPVAPSATYSATSAVCYGTATASLTVNGINGVAPYLYRLGTAGVYSSTNSWTNIKGATYKVYIQDANGCIGSISAVVPQPAAIGISFSKVDISCTAPGSITVIKTGGPSNPPYQYKLNTTVYGSGNTFNVATAGTYYGYIKDSLGCLARTVAIPMLAPTGCFSGSVAKAGQSSIDSKESNLKVALSPNPTAGSFTLKTYSSNNQLVSVRVLDENGRSVYVSKGQAAQTFSFGDKFANGLYLIEVKQGENVKTIKAVKGK